MNDYLPHCLSIGIRLDEFWELNITKLQPFIKAEELRNEKRNYELWLQGAYFHNAVSVALANMFSKGTKHEYPSEPYALSVRESKEKLIANEELLKQRIMAMANKMKEKNNE